MKPQSSQRQPGYRSFLRSLPVLGLYGALCALALCWTSMRTWELAQHFMVAGGVVQCWRLGTMGTHMIRALWYQFGLFPTWRRKAQTLPQDVWDVGRLVFIIPTFREKPAISRQMIQSVIAEISTLSCPVSIYLTTGSPDEDQVLMDELHRLNSARRELDIIFMRQSNKRSGMGFALRAMARAGIDERTLVVLMDGDTVLGPGILAKTLPMFYLRPQLGALTTDNLAITTGASWYAQWYDLRFSMRHRYMNSVSLSRKVLTLTGRFSIFRASITVTDEFLQHLEADHLENWLYGDIPFVTGDDKSTWFAVLKRGWEMIFVPDAYVICLEDSSDRPLHQGLAKMFRWFGNMLRNNGRALALGPRCTGWFPWWCLLDQRLSIWTTLLGPVLAIFLACTVDVSYLGLYLLIATLRRMFYLALLAFEGHQVRFMDIPLLYFNDWVGALMKISVLADLKNQRWAARQSGATRPASPRAERGHFLLANFRRFAWGVLLLLCILLYSQG